MWHQQLIRVQDYDELVPVLVPSTYHELDLTAGAKKKKVMLRSPVSDSSPQEAVVPGYHLKVLVHLEVLVEVLLQLTGGGRGRRQGEGVGVHKPKALVVVKHLLGMVLL